MKRLLELLGVRVRRRRVLVWDREPAWRWALREALAWWALSGFGFWLGAGIGAEVGRWL